MIHARDDGKEKIISFLNNILGNSDYLHNDRIIFFPPCEDVFSLYRFADIFISSSRSEGFSYSILEALYFNLKVFSSDIDGVGWSKQYSNVSFFDNCDVNQLSRLIESNAGFKKTNKTNDVLLHDFDIEKWSKNIKNIVLKQY